MSLFKKIFLWILGVLVFSFIILVAVLTVHFFNLDKTNAAVEKIHRTKLQLADVMGENLPPPPALPDETIAGVDANANGIRDDVELAIFSAYPKSAKTRAVLLQYGLVLQMQMTLPILNSETATAAAVADSRSYDCIGNIVPKSNDDLEKIEKLRKFVEEKQINAEERKKGQKNYNEKVGSFTLQSGCDIDLSAL